MGRIGEDAVCRWLEKAGYRIVCRNFCMRGGELDIIAENGEYLAFVEVKTRRLGSMTDGFSAVTPRKQTLLIRTAAAYLYAHPTTLQPRFDIAAVTTVRGAVQEISYLDNAFDTTGQDIIF